MTDTRLYGSEGRPHCPSSLDCRGASLMSGNGQKPPPAKRRIAPASPAELAPYCPGCACPRLGRVKVSGNDGAEVITAGLPRLIGRAAGAAVIAWLPVGPGP